MSGVQQKVLLSVLVSIPLFIAGCGESDKSASAPAPEAKPAAEATAEMPAAAPTEEKSFDINNIEKAEGVVYQDEIYANWPYN